MRIFAKNRKKHEILLIAKELSDIEDRNLIGYNSTPKIYGSPNLHKSDISIL